MHAAHRLGAIGLAILSILVFVSIATAQYSGGTGEPNDPYQIATAADLIALGARPDDYDKHFILTADIDLDPNLPGRRVFDRAVIAPYVYVGEYHLQGAPFNGSFDGNGHKIRHLTIEGEGYLGLFGRLESEASVEDLGVVDANVAGSGDRIGVLAGFSYEGTATQCHSTGAVLGRDFVGGLVGSNGYDRRLPDGGAVIRCSSSGHVSGSTRVGGLVGSNRGTITHSHSDSAVTGNDAVGGLVGWNRSARLTQCYSNGVASSAGGYVGGVVGVDSEGTVTQCYSIGAVRSTGGFVGGLVGSTWYSMISNCYSTASVSGRDTVGGLVGYNYEAGVFGSFWDIQTSGQAASVGGAGLTTAQMHDPETYQSAGWDFAGRWRDGTSEIWQMPAGGGCPILAVFSGYTPPQLQGQGTPDDPYLLHDALELGAMCHHSPWAHYRLACSIDLSDVLWSAAVVPSFAGTFDGNDQTISYLTITAGGYLGLFGQLDRGAAVKGLGLLDVLITGSGNYIGALAGNNLSDVSRCYSTGMVSGRRYVGGLIGDHGSGALTLCHNECSVSGNMHVGGLAGDNGGTVSDCHNTGSVSGTESNVGGMVGCHRGMIFRGRSAGAVTGVLNVGGLVGENDNGVVSESVSTGAVKGCEAVGGLVGDNSSLNDGIVARCFSTGKVSGIVYVGGLVGTNGWATISDSYSMSSASGTSYVGGLVGENKNGMVLNSYSVGSVTDTRDRVGGLVALNHWDGVVAHSFWDMNTSTQDTSDGGTGLTTAQMQDAEIFKDAGWDFVDETDNGWQDIWWIDEGQDYPRLSWELNEEDG